MAKTVSHLVNSISAVEETSEPSGMASLWRAFLFTLDLKNSRENRHVNHLEFFELDSVTIAVVSYWYEDENDQYPTLRIDVDDIFAADFRKLFEDFAFRRLLQDTISDSKCWLESGERLSSKDLKRIRRSVQKQITDFFNPREG